MDNFLVRWVAPFIMGIIPTLIFVGILYVGYKNFDFSVPELLIFIGLFEFIDTFSRSRKYLEGKFKNGELSNF